MAKAFLIRWGYDQDFKDIKLQTREPGFAVDSEKLYIGAGDKNIHIPNEDFIKAMIDDGILTYTPITGSTGALSTEQKNGRIAYNTDTKKLQYKTSAGVIIQNATTVDIPTYTPTSVVVSDDNIDANDSNSVTLTGVNRPLKMVFLNGSLCTLNASDLHRLSVDSVSGTIKIKECSNGDIIAYF